MRRPLTFTTHLHSFTQTPEHGQRWLYLKVIEWLDRLTLDQKTQLRVHPATSQVSCSFSLESFWEVETCIHSFIFLLNLLTPQDLFPCLTRGSATLSLTPEHAFLAVAMATLSASTGAGQRTHTHTHMVTGSHDPHTWSRDPHTWSHDPHTWSHDPHTWQAIYVWWEER